MSFYVGGAAGMRNRGTYAAGTQYFANDLVQYNGSSYIATATTLGNDPTNTSYWGALASAGSTATVSLGTVTALAPGATPTVTNTGTASAAVFNFGLPATRKVTATNIALGTQAASQAGFTWTTVPSICVRGMVSLLTITADSAGSFDVEVRGAASTGNLWMQAIGVTTAAYANPTVWYYENDTAAQDMYVGIRNTVASSHSFTLTSLRLERYA